MNFGLAVFPTDEGLRPGELARLPEDRGFESLFFPVYSHIAASRESHFDPSRGELGPEYSRIFDPFVALSLAAGATETLRLGTGICLGIERDPTHTAKSVASLDYLSGGRFLFGIGAGWNLEEMRNHGTDPRRRFARMRERIEAMKAIWTCREASYRGEFARFDRIWA